jgi:hypothetical protein
MALSMLKNMTMGQVIFQGVGKNLLTGTKQSLQAMVKNFKQEFSLLKRGNKT